MTPPGFGKTSPRVKQVPSVLLGIASSRTARGARCPSSARQERVLSSSPTRTPIPMGQPARTSVVQCRRVVTPLDRATAAIPMPTHTQGKPHSSVLSVWFAVDTITTATVQRSNSTPICSVPRRVRTRASRRASLPAVTAKLGAARIACLELLARHKCKGVASQVRRRTASDSCPLAVLTTPSENARDTPRG